jgi:hypothetical protein
MSLSGAASAKAPNSADVSGAIMIAGTTTGSALITGTAVGGLIIDGSAAAAVRTVLGYSERRNVNDNRDPRVAESPASPRQASSLGRNRNASTAVTRRQSAGVR